MPGADRKPSMPVRRDSAAAVEAFLDKARTVPAAVETMAERGRLPLAQVMAPAVRAAAEGFEVSPYLAHCAAQSAADLAAFPASAEVFLPEGRPLRAGERLLRRDYAGTLVAICT